LLAAYVCPALAAHGVIEAGDTGVFSIPFSNREDGTSVIRNARVVLSSVPYWVSVDTGISLMGPMDIHPSEDVMFKVYYVINNKVPRGRAEADIRVSVVTDSPQLMPAGITWRFKTDNGFLTLRGDCVDNTGTFCGEYTAPDTLEPAPIAEIEDTFDGETLFYAGEGALPWPPRTPTWKVCAGNVPAASGSGSGAAVLLQSFLADCDSVEAVRLWIGDSRSWGVLELLESDVSGAPGRILARTALNWSNCGVDVYGPTTFPVRKTQLTRARKYFIRYRHGVGAIPFTFTEGDAYKEGEFTGGKPGWDLEFQVLSGAVEAPYLRRVSVGAECDRELRHLAAGSEERSPETAFPLDEACNDVELSSSPVTPTQGSIDWILGRLFSYKYEVKQEGFSAFWPLQEEEKNKIVLALYQYLDYGDEQVRRNAREALKAMGAFAKVLLPRLMDRFRKNGTEIDLISSMGYGAAPAVPELLIMLKKTGSLALADALANIGTEDSRGALVDYYIAHMRAEMKKLQAASIDTRVPERLPEGCIMRELLPESVRKATGQMAWDGVSFGVMEGPLSEDNDERHLNAWQAGKLLNNTVILEKGNYLMLSGCGWITKPIAEEIRNRLGMDARHIAVRGGCLARGEYPENIKALVPEMEGYSGIEFSPGTSKESCDTRPGCKLFPKQEFEELVGARIPHFFEPAQYSMAPCRLENDDQALMRKAKQDALKDSGYKSDPELKAFLKDLTGKWCGRLDYPNNAKVEMRMAFSESDGVLIGDGIRAYARSGTDWPKGQDVYAENVEYIPMRMSRRWSIGEAIFTQVSKYQSGSVWYVRKEGDGFFLTGPGDNGLTYIMARECKDFWTDPGK